MCPQTIQANEEVNITQFQLSPVKVNQKLSRTKTLPGLFQSAPDLTHLLRKTDLEIRKESYRISHTLGQTKCPEIVCEREKTIDLVDGIPQFVKIGVKGRHPPLFVNFKYEGHT